jgi:esterase/lipase
LLAKLKREDANHAYLHFSGDDGVGNYSRNPVSGIQEVGEFLEELRGRYEKIRVPALILQSEANAVVDAKGSQRLFAQIGSTDKEFCLLAGARHIMVADEDAEHIHARIATFLRRL